MRLTKCNIVWLKKDLRVFDHQALANACENNITIAMYVLEDEWISSKEFSLHQFQFLRESLYELREELAKLNIPFVIQKGGIISSLQNIQQHYIISGLYSHIETGVKWTYIRDRKVSEWCKGNGIEWKEYYQFSAIRKLKSRDTWNEKRKKLIERRVIFPPKKQNFSLKLGVKNNLAIDEVFNEVTTRNYLNIQKGGRSNGLFLLTGFLDNRGMDYSSKMSSPNTAYDSCSRISSHITWGTLSLTEIHHATKNAYDKHYEINGQASSKRWQRSLRAFESRLWWHCHFIQKLESEPSIEFRNINAGFDGMRENSFNNAYFEAWKKGETGYPMIDACMRALIEHGWINFRMRAMLQSFAAYQLWLHWERPANHLAKLFTDFEPGIHYSQAQMQSGVTGINAIRIYSPFKQARDQDPNGKFIRKYCPELSSLSDQNIHEPYNTSPIEQITSGVHIGVDYPHPIVDHASAYKAARNTIYKWKSSNKTKKLAKEVYEKHGSRKNKYFPKQKRNEYQNNKQIDLGI